MKLRKSLLIICFLLVGVLNALAPVKASASDSDVYVLEVKGTIVPVVADYINRGISIAESHNAICIIQLDTPGGLGSSMEEICQRIITARVPVVIYVMPGGWAASAGTYIAMASHIAAMGPGSSIGAASPVAGGGAEMTETEKQKAINFYEAYMAALAEERNHNVVWAKQAVRDAISATANEAFDLNVIDLLADDVNSLITQLDGMTVTLQGGQEVTLTTEGSTRNNVPMNTVERFLLAITNPNIAYILLSLAMLGIFLELSNPGSILPGVLGGICLLLAFYSLAMLSAQWAGVLLIVLAFVLFILEIFVTSGGLLIAGAVAALTMGSLILFSGHSVVFQINPWLIGGVVVAITLFFVFVVAAVIRAHRRRPTTGREGLISKMAVAKTPLEPSGIVFVRGENWTAIVEGERVEVGEEVIVTKVDGLKLWVTKIK